MSGKVTGIIPGVILIVILVIGFVIINSTTNKSSSNYAALKSYMSPDSIKAALEVITNCGISNYEIVRDEALDTLDGENTLGFRLKSTNYNAVMYIKDDSIYSIRYADNDLYRNNTVVKNINDIK